MTITDFFTGLFEICERHGIDTKKIKAEQVGKHIILSGFEGLPESHETIKKLEELYSFVPKDCTLYVRTEQPN